MYFDELDAAWKVDSTAFGVANNVAVQASMDYSDIEARIEAASGKSLTFPPSVTKTSSSTPLKQTSFRFCKTMICLMLRAVRHTTSPSTPLLAA